MVENKQIFKDKVYSESELGTLRLKMIKNMK